MSLDLKFAFFKKKSLFAFLFFFKLIFLASCSSRLAHQENKLMSIQFVDRHGFRETISAEDRLALFQKVDFLHPQPYEKVTRVYMRNQEGKTPSRITTYHENGQPWQYLEVVSGRACGTYREWHPNGQLRLDVMVIEGIGDLGQEAQLGWIFDGLSRAWDEYGHLMAEIHYQRGVLQGNALYYHQNGRISKILPYEKGGLHGEVILYDEAGEIVGKSQYHAGKRHGLSTFKGDNKAPTFSEEYNEDLLLRGVYFDFSGKVIAEIEGGKGKKAFFSDGKLTSLHEFVDGRPEGEVRVFDETGNLISSYCIKDALKHGEEWFYYPSLGNKSSQPKLCINWYKDEIHGICRTWYPDGTLESEREMVENKKNGIFSAWYRDGSLMFLEEYENDLLNKGKYLRRGDPTPVSTIERGDGTATLYDNEGNFIRKIPYQKGKPINDSP